ncbi:MAG: malonic semialdehyde reductase [Kutzneria sp.]|nr:malonic semialdehyde reductase [Kutzneria sp.]MBV9845743.1 malonic semialdehyde reductase [Kutzneria sp.]
MTAATDLLALQTEAQALLFRDARTANTFTDEPVTDDQVRAIYELVKWAPTSMNMQPLRVLLVRSEQARQRLVPHLMEGNRAKTASAPLVAILSADTDFHETLPRVFPHLPGAKDFYTDDDARRETARLNAALQVGYFILGVRAAGLAAGPMTGFDPEGVRREFFADTAQQPLVIVNIGHPGEDAWFGRSPRLEYDEVVTAV